MPCIVHPLPILKMPCIIHPLPIPNSIHIRGICIHSHSIRTHSEAWQKVEGKQISSYVPSIHIFHIHSILFHSHSNHHSIHGKAQERGRQTSSCAPREEYCKGSSCSSRGRCNRRCSRTCGGRGRGRQLSLLSWQGSMRSRKQKTGGGE